MKNLVLVLSVLFSFNVHADQLTDVKYTFDPNRVANMQSSENLLTYFVDYFYLLIQANHSLLAIDDAMMASAGWCAGDAHMENFGYLIAGDGKSVFAVNDIDDSGPCPVALDLYRLMVDARLLNSKVDLQPMLLAYQKGLMGMSYTQPSVLVDLQSKSEDRGNDVDPKDVDKNRFVRSGDTREVSSDLSKEISGMLKAEKILDLIERMKDYGGSAGMARYEVLLGGSPLRHLELKEESRPSIYPVATNTIPAVADRLQRALDLTLPNRSADYGYSMFAGKSFLKRPRFYGNTPVRVAKLSSTELQLVANYEAWALGRFHAQAAAKPWSESFAVISVSTWERWVSLMTDQIQRKYQSLHPI